MIYLGSDHRGYELKTRLFQWLKDEGYDVIDLGNDHLDPDDDYVDFAHKVAEATVSLPENRGILLCGSGVGVDIVANKVKGVRSALVFDAVRAKQAREHEDANVIALPADVLDEEKVEEIIKIFIETPFSNDPRHLRRLEKIEEIEKQQ